MLPRRIYRSLFSQHRFFYLSPPFKGRMRRRKRFKRWTIKVSCSVLSIVWSALSEIMDNKKTVNITSQCSHDSMSLLSKPQKAESVKSRTNIWKESFAQQATKLLCSTIHRSLAEVNVYLAGHSKKLKLTAKTTWASKTKSETPNGAMTSTMKRKRRKIIWKEHDSSLLTKLMTSTSTK